MKIKTIGIAAAIIVVALLAYLFVFNKRSVAPESTSTQGTQESASEEDSAQNSSASPQSLKELVAGSSSVKCTFNQAGSQGTMYVSGGKARGDFTSNDQKGHMIIADNISYVWMDGTSQGFKSSLKSTASVEGSGATQGVDANQKLNYSCGPWTAEPAMFALPSSVQFMDVEAMMKAQ